MSGYDSDHRKRKRSRSPTSNYRDRDRSYRSRDELRNNSSGSKPKWSHKDQARINQIQEDERMREWVSQEDDFVLKQAKKKAEIRVKEGRAKPIDWLAVTLRIIDDTRDNPLDDEVQDEDLEFVDPESVLEGMDADQLSELRKDIDTYEKLETNRKNRDYWRTMQIICKDRQRKAKGLAPEQRAVSGVSSDIEKLLAPKTYEELESLEKQIRAKLDSNEPIDTDYWQQLLDSLLIWKAKSKVKKVYKAVLDVRLKTLKRENEQEAKHAQQTLASSLDGANIKTVSYSKSLDPDAALHLATKHKNLEVMDESTFLDQISSARTQILRQGYVPATKSTKPQIRPQTKSTTDDTTTATTMDLFKRDVARGVDEDEEVFSAEEPLPHGPNNTISSSTHHHKDKLRPRKPLYFNRLLLGYDWNKYNQTHYSADAPPPKVVQGYKFHIFYPDLLDITKAPTYKIIRENGRRKGETMAPAGEEDTCIIVFSAGKPYEDLAFRIVDRDWDYSARGAADGPTGRGFKSVFEKGVLSLHFGFKKVYYRK